MEAHNLTDGQVCGSPKSSTAGPFQGCENLRDLTVSLTPDIIFDAFIPAD
jgi:hypothetical protein